ncbi:hypothetical protein KC362_g18 [Hortaea werneckii]|nr:hypothetical protein KC362_g18 [Hortaea werneckii]
MTSARNSRNILGHCPHSAMSDIRCCGLHVRQQITFGPTVATGCVYDSGQSCCFILVGILLLVSSSESRLSIFSTFYSSRAGGEDGCRYNHTVGSTITLRYAPKGKSSVTSVGDVSPPNEHFECSTQSDGTEHFPCRLTTTYTVMKSSCNADV